jgi:dihydrofolate reductase
MEVPMSKVRVAAFSISVDGYGAGPDQSIDHPLGRGGEALHDWLTPTRTFKKVEGQEGGSTGIDEDFAAMGFDDVGAWILGRNMFGPVRGEWPDDSWRGWWGENPPFHVPTFVLTHHGREAIEMEGGTVFRFATGGIEDALRQAREVAGGKDIRIGGGASTIRQYLEARLIDEMHLAIAPVVLGSGERLFDGIDLVALGYEVKKMQAGEAACHFIVGRK